jgi:tRNA nucleotidyltransferase (CCA-adding enzyme)
MATEAQAGWEHFSHAADIGVRGRGATPAAAFEQAAIALTALITDPASVQPRQMVEFACTAPDLELLFADWLNALIYEMSTRRLLFGRFEIEIQDSSLKAHAWGEAVDRARHQPVVEPKGATYTELSVRQDEAGNWIAQCVIDV